MPYPTELRPDPLIMSTVELRFRSNSNIEPGSLLSRVLPTFLEVFPNYKPANKPAIPPPGLDVNYLADHTLSNEHYILGLGPNVISFENSGKYTLWNNYYPFIKVQLNKFFDLGIVEEVQRIGIRYASILQNLSGVNQALRTVPSFQFPGFDEQLSMIRSEFKKQQYSFNIQILPRAIVEKNGQQRSGMVVDIDAYFNNSIQADENVFRIIDELHSREKELFFDHLLKQEFIEQLNPIF